MSGEKSKWAARFGVFGDLPTRFLLFVLHIVPWFLEPVLIAVWTTFFFLIAKKQRQAVAGNLRALHQWGAVRGLLGAWRVFLNFSLTFVEGLRCQTQTGEVDWTVIGTQHLEDLSARTEGCLVLTAHMGNYDIAAPVFANRFNRTLYTVRAPEREQSTRELREQEIERREAENPKFRTLYNKEGNLLGVELARILGEGAIVAIQGDRVVFEVASMEVEVEPGLKMTLPRGPLYLAQATGAPCFPLFIVRDGWRRYRIEVKGPVELPPRQRGKNGEASVVWARTILDIARKNWAQWYVFEPVLRRTRA